MKNIDIREFNSKLFHHLDEIVFSGDWIDFSWSYCENSKNSTLKQLYSLNNQPLNYLQIRMILD